MIEMEIMDTEDAGNNEVLFVRMNNCSWATGVWWSRKCTAKLLGELKSRWRRTNRTGKNHYLASSTEIISLGNNGGWNCQVRLWWRRLTSPDCCSSLTAGGQPDIPSCPVCCDRQHRTPPGTQPRWKAELESHQASRSTTSS